MWYLISYTAVNTGQFLHRQEMVHLTNDDNVQRMWVIEVLRIETVRKLQTIKETAKISGIQWGKKAARI